MSNLTSILPTSALPTDVVPTAFPTGYETATPPAPTAGAGDGETDEEGDGEAPPSGSLTLQALLDWIRKILEKAFQGHTEADGETEKAVKRSHARALKVE